MRYASRAVTSLMSGTIPMSGTIGIWAGYVRDTGAGNLSAAKAKVILQVHLPRGALHSWSKHTKESSSVCPPIRDRLFRALLRGELIRLRREGGLTQEQVAAQLEWSPSKLIRVEGGRSSITKVDLDALLIKYGVTSESTRERLQFLNRGSRDRGW